MSTTTAISIPSYINASWSLGYGKNGKIFLYLRPNIDCFNKVRKVNGFSVEDILVKADKVINKWYKPLCIYEIDGRTIASNNEQNALKEYWRVCECENIKKQFEIKLISSL